MHMHLATLKKCSQATPFVSIIVPTHNRPAMLAEALMSVRLQTFTDYEVIVVANGETPEMSALSRACAMRYGAVYELPVGNLPAARNFGIKAARGKWIAFLDDDDIWLPAKLERQLAEAEKTKADMIVCNHLDLFPNGSEHPNKWVYPEGWPPLKALCHQKWVALPSSVLITKEALEAVDGFDERQRVNEDSELWRRIAWRHKIHRMNEVLLKYRTGHTRISTNRIKANTYDARHYLKMYFDAPQDLRWALPPVTTCVRRLVMRMLMPRWMRQPRKWWAERNADSNPGKAV
jgi:glycosyltransferase involved in cell wall biosynthesis